MDILSYKDVIKYTGNMYTTKNQGAYNLFSAIAAACPPDWSIINYAIPSPSDVEYQTFSVLFSMEHGYLWRLQMTTSSNSPNVVSSVLLDAVGFSLVTLPATNAMYYNANFTALSVTYRLERFVSANAYDCVAYGKLGARDGAFGSAPLQEKTSAIDHIIFYSTSATALFDANHNLMTLGVASFASSNNSAIIQDAIAKLNSDGTLVGSAAGVLYAGISLTALLEYDVDDVHHISINSNILVPTGG